MARDKRNCGKFREFNKIIFEENKKKIGCFKKIVQNSGNYEKI